jgi:hypothetical protein
MTLSRQRSYPNKYFFIDHRSINKNESGLIDSDHIFLLPLSALELSNNYFNKLKISYVTVTFECDYLLTLSFYHI